MYSLLLLLLFWLLLFSQVRKAWTDLSRLRCKYMWLVAQALLHPLYQKQTMSSLFFFSLLLTHHSRVSVTRGKHSQRGCNSTETHTAAQLTEQGNSEGVDSATVCVVCSVYSMYGLFFPFVLGFVIASSVAAKLSTFEWYNRIRECTFNSHLKLSSPDVTQYISKLLLLLIICIIYLFRVSSLSLLACLPPSLTEVDLELEQTDSKICHVRFTICAHLALMRQLMKPDCVSNWSLIITASSTTLFVIKCAVRMSTAGNTLFQILQPM